MVTHPVSDLGSTNSFCWSAERRGGCNYENKMISEGERQEEVVLSHKHLKCCLFMMLCQIPVRAPWAVKGRYSCLMKYSTSVWKQENNEQWTMGSYLSKKLTRNTSSTTRTRKSLQSHEWVLDLQLKTYNPSKLFVLLWPLNFCIHLIKIKRKPLKKLNPRSP